MRIYARKHNYRLPSPKYSGTSLPRRSTVSWERRGSHPARQNTPQNPLVGFRVGYREPVDGLGLHQHPLARHIIRQSKFLMRKYRQNRESILEYGKAEHRITQGQERRWRVRRTLGREDVQYQLGWRSEEEEPRNGVKAWAIPPSGLDSSQGSTILAWDPQLIAALQQPRSLPFLSLVATDKYLHILCNMLVNAL